MWSWIRNVIFLIDTGLQAGGAVNLKSFNRFQRFVFSNFRAKPLKTVPLKTHYSWQRAEAR